MKLAQMDAIEWLKTLPSNSVNLLITDVPYQSLEKYRKIGTTTRLSHSKSSSNDWFSIFPNDRFSELFEQVYRVLENNSHFYFFCDQETMFVAKPLAEAAGFTFWKPIVWDKMAIGMGYHYRARYEFILFFEKGKRNLKDRGMPDILEFKRIRKQGSYPTEKPVPLYEALIRQSSNEGDVIADPFFGSGASLVAGLNLGRQPIGNDISDDAHAYIHNRKISPVKIKLNENGYGSHPDYPCWSSDTATCLINEWFTFNGISSSIVYLEDDASEELSRRVFSDGIIDIREWKPTPPADNAFLLSIHDTESGPVAIFALPNEVTAKVSSEND